MDSTSTLKYTYGQNIFDGFQNSNYSFIYFSIKYIKWLKSCENIKSVIWKVIIFTITIILDKLWLVVCYFDMDLPLIIYHMNCYDKNYGCLHGAKFFDVKQSPIAFQLDS